MLVAPSTALAKMPSPVSLLTLPPTEIRLVPVPNGGKNSAIRAAIHEYIVASASADVLCLMPQKLAELLAVTVAPGSTITPTSKSG